MVTKKYVRIVILLACGIALTLASSGCKKKDEGQAKKTAPDKGPAVTAPDREPKVATPDREPKVATPGKEPGKTFPDRPKKALVMQPLVGIGKVRFGMTIEQMKEILGEPVRSRGIIQEYRDLGFAILTIKENTVTMIACGDRRRADSPLIKSCTVRTKKGIGMGSGKEDVIKAYGQPSSTQQIPGPGGDDAVVLRYDALNSEFQLRSGKVTYMMFRAEGFAAQPRRGRPRPPRPPSR
ncbi:MAG: hypothetical protein ACYS30_20570 [Planctomycetota bacterium]